MNRSTLDPARSLPDVPGQLLGDSPASLYRIDGVDRLRPFLCSIVTDCDLWMYVSSNGALTAGRRNEDGALFPYGTDDLLHDAAGRTGPVTVVRVRTASGAYRVWRPFAPGEADAGVRRSLAKSVAGDRIVFEEAHRELGLAFRASWRGCDRFGWTRRVELTLDADASTPVQLQLLDGLRDLLPANAELANQRNGSCLINAYTRCELDAKTGMAIVALASRIVDRAEPSESLHANVVWQTGLRPRAILLSPDQVDRFARTGDAKTESELRGRRGAYFVVAELSLKPGETRHWHIVADARRSQAQVIALQKLIANDSSLPSPGTPGEGRVRAGLGEIQTRPSPQSSPGIPGEEGRSGERASLSEQIDAACEAASRRLESIVAGADGSQRTADAIASAHHFSNTLFNCMRGGALLDDGVVPVADFRRFVETRSRSVRAKHASFLNDLPASLSHRELVTRCDRAGDVNLYRLALEYLPLTFGRRHGDPSRPWNRFDIVTAHADGSPALNYEGNWRDIFQNWEALVASYGDFIEPVIAKFVNASTPDGFNPYRVTRAGIDWEVPDPHNPWGHIGYWGDHQIVYLLRLLEASRRVRPDALPELLARAAFSYADVPYRLVSHAEMCADPKHTIRFDWDAHRASMKAVDQIGTDGRLVRDGAGQVVHVTLAEKLLVPALSKLSSLVAGAGIWMNTQRPEWNDANNALVGNGTSMVTLAYLRRYLGFLSELLQQSGERSMPMRKAVAAWASDVAHALESCEPMVAAKDASAQRALLDKLGGAFERYRATQFEVVPASVDVNELQGLIDVALNHLDAAIAVNRRPDGLFHAYNLLLLSDGRAEIERLDAMLEGQVAILSSGALDASSVVHLLEAMFRSKLWRADQRTFMLYPAREPTPFTEKGVLGDVSIGLVDELLKQDDSRIITRGDDGRIRFNAEFRNVTDLVEALDRLASDPMLAPPIARDRASLLDEYERVFHHRAFTGRSGSMFGYEGIGCVYWHMVAKLLVAVQECFQHASSNDPARARLATLYYQVRFGLGFNKTPGEYGAFPLDAYSHTPMHAGAQQPGMTGQVKEEILTRLGELGVRIEAGQLRFEPALLRRSEFLSAPATWSPCAGETIQLDRGSLGFTLSGVPIVYHVTDQPASMTIRSPLPVSCERDRVRAGVSTNAEEPSPGVPGEGEATRRVDGLVLDKSDTQALMSRCGTIARIDVNVPASSLMTTQEAE
ncbi:MAG: hypothetical protein QM770_04615 [Tepidisphaeraceae bacterium]